LRLTGLIPRPLGARIGLPPSLQKGGCADDWLTGSKEKQKRCFFGVLREGLPVASGS
jgi:hypothetical protein